MSPPAASVRTGRALALIAGGLLCLLPPASNAQSGFHSSSITRIAVDDADRILVTASEDQTVRIWELPTGRLRRTIATPPGRGGHAEILALAVSPDGTRVAFSGYTGQKNQRVVDERTHFDYEIYIHDVRTGKRLQTLDTPAVIDRLAYSSSGDLLLATASELPVDRWEEINPSSDALQLWRVSDYSRIELRYYTIYAAVADFDQQGGLIAVTRTGGQFTISRHDRDFRELDSRDFRGDPAQIRISPDGSMFAISTLYSSLEVRSIKDLTLIHEQDVRGESDSDSSQYSAVAWSVDGRSLYFSGPGTCNEKGCAIRKWEVDRWESPQDIVVSPHRVTDLAAMKTGGVAFATAGPSFGVVDANNRRILYRKGPNRPAPQITKRSQSRQAAKESTCYDRNLFVSDGADVPGRHVYIDRSGRVAITPPFSELGPFSGGLARVWEGEKQGYIDRSGRLAIPVKFDQALDFSEGRAAVRIGDRAGYIDETGKMVVAPKFREAYSFSDGLARVREGNYYGYINKAGQVVVPPKFTSAGDFHEGLAAVQLHEEWGYINRSGEWVIKPAFDSAWRFSEGLAIIRREPCASRTCMHDFIDSSGTTVVKSIPLPDAETWFSGSLALLRESLVHYGFIDKMGRTAIPAEFRQATPFAEGLAAVSLQEGKWGYVDGQGSFVVPPEYTETSAFSDGRGRVLQDGRWGYVDRAGRAVIPPRLHEASRFSEGLAAVCIAADVLSAFPEAPAPVQIPRQDRSDRDELPMPQPREFRLSDADAKRVEELHQRVISLSEERRYIEALPFAREALELVELELPRDHAALIQPLLDLARVHRALGAYRSTLTAEYPDHQKDYKEAKELFERALPLITKHRGANQAAAAALIDQQADLLGAMNQFDEAMDLKRRVIAIRKRLDGSAALPVLQAANDIEILLVGKLLYPEYGKQLSKALPLTLSQISAAEDTLGPDHSNVARGLNNLARIYSASKIGVLNAAIHLHERVLRMHTKAWGANHWEALAAVAAMARLHANAHDYATAEPLFDSMLEVGETVLGPRDPALFQLRSEQAFLFRASGDYARAAAQFEHVLAYWDQVLAQSDERHPIVEVRHVQEWLADTYHLMGEYRKAESLYTRILDSKDRLIGMPGPNVARVMRKLGTMQRLRQDTAGAKETLEKLLKLLNKDLSQGSDMKWSYADTLAKQTLEELAGLLLTSGDPDAARVYLNRADPMYNRELRFTMFRGSDRELISVDDDISASYYHQVLLLTSRNFREDQASVDRAFELVLNRKGIALDLELRARALHVNLSERERRDLEELSRVRSELAGLLLSKPASITDEQYAQKVTLLFERGATLEHASYRLSSRWDQVPSTRITKQDIVSNLPPDTALVEFVRVRDVPDSAGEAAKYLAFVLLPSGQLSLVELGTARSIDELIMDTQSSLRARASRALITELLTELHKKILAKLEGFLDGVQQVLVSPDGELHRVPFAALLDANGQYAIDRFLFAYVGSGRDLLPVRSRPAAPRLDLVVIADPDFDGGEASTSAANRFQPLPGTTTEAELILPLVAGTKGKQVLKWREATEAALRTTANPRILHIATHGFFLERSDLGLRDNGYEHALVRSGLALAGANHSDDLDPVNDGLLTALEVSGMDLTGTELVVLSACDSGAGAVTRGQGVLGLRRAFALAGAKSLLLTLWPVDDEVTAEMMAAFYKSLAELPAAESLHRAQRQVAERLSEKNGYANPRLWAAFILQSSIGFASTVSPQ